MTSGYNTMIDSPKNNDSSVLVLHEYCVPPSDADYFLNMFNFMKGQLHRQGYTT